MTETPYQRVAREQRERKAAREERAKQARRRAVPGGRWRSGAHKSVRSHAADRIDGYDRDDLGESPDY
jgi:hypothetical protein